MPDSETIYASTYYTVPSRTTLDAAEVVAETADIAISAYESRKPTKPVGALPDSGESIPPTYINPGVAYTLVEEPDKRYRIIGVGSTTRVTPLSPFGPLLSDDNRTRITNTTAWPYSVQGHLIITYPDGSQYIGSGTMVNKHHAITAGHVVYSKANGGWATSVQFNAAQNDDTLPYGIAWATRLFTFTGWTNNQDRNWDMGMLILNTDLGNQTGWLGLIAARDSDLSNHQVTVAGYPGDKGGRQLWAASAPIVEVLSDQVRYNAYTKGGDSGAGVYGFWPGIDLEHVCSDHVAGPNGVPNTGCRMTQTKFDRIVNEWFPA
jgi:V8-like Glu-specific endopeptidase